MKRKILSVIISAALIIAAVAPSFTIANAAVWSGSSSVPSVSGGVYQIASGENLAWFANAVNNGSRTIKAKLTADIQLNSSGSTTHKWTPIGTQNNPFSGSFDGNGFTISGVYVDTQDYNAGFFGYVAYPDSGEASEDVSPEYIVGTMDYNIQNVVITDSSVNGTQNVGGIVGYASNAGFLNCSYSGTVTGTENSVGGIAGWCCASTVISESHSSGTVTGHQRTGGIAGYLSGNAVAVKCYSDADVIGYTNVGGMVGTLSSASMIAAFFLGSVSADNRAGGLVGYSAFGTMKTAYTISTVTKTSSGKNDFGGAVGVIYSGTYSSIFYCYETSGVDGPQGLGRTVEEMKSTDFVKEVNRSSPYFCCDYTEINNGYPVLMWMLQLDVWAGDRVMPEQNSSGTYLISKPSELAWFAALVNGTLSGFPQNTAANATVTDNLLFNIDVYDDTMSKAEWTPIGTSSDPYTGTFNGNGYNIAGVYIGAENAGNNTGLFGYISGGSVTGVVLVGSLIQGRENVGGIAGYMMGGSITNCLCSSEVCGDRAVGGIAGNINAPASISLCGMNGVLTGTNVCGDETNLQNLGGIVGYINRATVTKCFSSAKINAPLTRWAGGIVGNNSIGTVTSCYSTSTVTGNIFAGGVAGYNNNGTVQKCYVAGKVASSQSGIVFGQIQGSGYSYCYYDSSLKSAANNDLGAAAKTPAQMTGAYSTSNVYLGGDFASKNDDTYFFYYPQITSIMYSSYNALKNASLESVKRVQNRFIARVEIDGRTDTYYETLTEAFDYAASTPSMILPTVFLVRDFELTETLDIPSTVCFFGENEAVLLRAASLTAEMINVTGTLTIGSPLYGEDSEPQFFIDGGNIQGTQSAIVVPSSGTLKVEDGVVVRNCMTATTSVRGAAVNVSGGSFQMAGGLFTDNECKTVGGALYNEEGTVTVSGGTFADNESKTQGGAIYNNNGTVTVTGGLFSGNRASTYGGAITGYGISSLTQISGRTEITGNEATFGGALCVMNYGTLEIHGGVISGNRGYSQGGALYIENNSEAIVSGGEIEGNTVFNASNPAYGSAVYNDGDLYLRGSAKIDSDNDVYLPSGKYLSIDDRLTCSGYAATITPQIYSEGVKVLDGSMMISYYTKIGVSNTGWHVLASGKLTNKSTTSVAVLSKNNSYSIEYVNLADAFAAVGDDDTAIITVIADNIITGTIPVHGDVTLTCDEVTCTSMRSGAFDGIMFDVQQGATLRFGDVVENMTQQAQSDYLSGTVTAGQMVIDGGYESTGIVGAAAVNVQNGGTFCMYDDAIITNCNNTLTSAVTVSGEMHMYGGTISGNTSKFGGGIYVMTSGKLYTYGGVIAGNTSSSGGDAVYSLGRVTRTVQSYDCFYSQIERDSQGQIISIGDPEYQFTLKTDIFIPEDETVYLNSNIIYMAEASETVYVTSISDLPESDSFIFRNMTIALKTYKSGNVAVSGTKVSTYYTGFTPAQYGFGVLNTGLLGYNKIIPKSSSGMTVQTDKALLSGIVLGQNTVTLLGGKFENARSALKFYSADGKSLTSSATLTTGCQIRLLDAGRSIDRVNIVVYGDVNADEIIDGRDAVLINAIAGGLMNSDNTAAAVLESADVNFDGNVTALDADSVEACGVFLQTIDQTR